MPRKKDIRKKLVEQTGDKNLLFADGFDEAIVGVEAGDVNRVAYDASKIIKILMKRDKMTYEEANEFYHFNIKGAYVGERTPLYYLPIE
jgi:hypothetical protein